MINTFHTSYNPPPVPPRTGYSRPPSPGNTPLVKFLSVMLLLLMIQNFGGFLYLFHKLNAASPACEKAAAMIAPAPPFKGPAAHLVLSNKYTPSSSSSSKQLVWNKDQSMLRDVKLSGTGDTLNIQYPGIYFIYSQITFSKHSSSSLKQSIYRKGPSDQDPEDKEILKSYCSLDPHIADLCTASLSGVFDLQKDQQLYVKVTNTSLLNRDSCSFGLFKLQ